MKEIRLTQGKTALVDDEDYVYLSQWKWHYSHGYAIRAEIVNNKQIKIYMHRFVMSAPKNVEIDHVNQNKLDNCKNNLRLATRKQNTFNVGKKSNNTSGYKGVSFQKNANKWAAYIEVDGRKVHLGLFYNPIEAAYAYDDAAKKHFGEFAATNESLGYYNKWNCKES